MFIVRMARKHGVADDRIKGFFEEYHQYFQADFSSYTSASEYQKMTGEKKVGKETSLAKYLEKESPIEANDEAAVGQQRQLKINSESRGFEYADTQSYKTRFADLQRMFASPEVIRATFEELAGEEERLEAHKNRRRFADPVT